MIMVRAHVNTIISLQAALLKIRLMFQQLVGRKNMTGSSWLVIYCPYTDIPTVSLGLTRSIRLMPD